MSLLSRDERLAAGKALRDAVPRARHAAWKPPVKQRDCVDVLNESNQGRLGYWKQCPVSGVQFDFL